MDRDGGSALTFFSLSELSETRRRWTVHVTAIVMVGPMRDPGVTVGVPLGPTGKEKKRRRSLEEVGKSATSRFLMIANVTEPDLFQVPAMLIFGGSLLDGSPSYESGQVGSARSRAGGKDDILVIAVAGMDTLLGGHVRHVACTWGH
jgi:hypothetical protein